MDYVIDLFLLHSLLNHSSLFLSDTQAFEYFILHVYWHNKRHYSVMRHSSYHLAICKKFYYS
jgi:hypothetical protein